MDYYRDRNTGEVFAYETAEDFETYGSSSLVEMTETEIQQHLAPPVLSLEEVTANALRERDGMLAQAAIRIAPLQDAVDLGEANASEEQALIAWKRYRVAVNRVEQQGGFPADIDWPAPPA